MKTDLNVDELWVQSDVQVAVSDWKNRDGCMINGKLSLVKKAGKIYLSWIPLEEAFSFVCNSLDLNDWVLVDSQSDRDNSKNKLRAKNIWIDIAVELKSITVNHGNGLGSPYADVTQYPTLEVVLKTKEGQADPDIVPTFEFHRGLSCLSSLVKLLNKFFWLQKMSTNSPNIENYIILDHMSALLNVVKEDKAVSIKKKPFSTILASLSKTTTLLQKEFMNHLKPVSLDSKSDLETMLDERKAAASDIDLSCRDIQMKYFLSDPPVIQISDQMTREDWEGYFNITGAIINVEKLFEDICTKGTSLSIRGEVWKFLLGYYPFTSTYESRKLIDTRRKEAYYILKNQWTTVLPEQEDNWLLYSQYKSTVDKDVRRTDKDLPFFFGNDSNNSVLLNDILMSHVMYNFDTGYVQGMSDLCAPMLHLYNGDEVDTFWCFAGLMKIAGINFMLDQNHILTLMKSLRKLIEYVWPTFYTFLQERDATDLHFSFPWLLINFKRSFNYEDAMRLWEYMWCQKICIHYVVFLSAAVIGSESNNIMSQNLDSDNIMAYFNKISHCLNVDSLIDYTNQILQGLKNQKYLPPEISELIL